MAYENMLRAMYFAENAGCTIYFPHLSSDLGLVEARRYRERYERIYLETCPHYLTHTMDADIGSIGRANPPFRTQADVDALWQGLADGTIDVIASDHVPRKRATKETGIWQASQGFPGTATILPVLLSEGYRRRGCRPDNRRFGPGAGGRSGRTGILFRLQPLRRMENEGLAGRVSPWSMASSS